MKRMTMIPVLMMGCSLFFSCSKNESSPVRSADPANQESAAVISAAGSARSAGTHGYVLRRDSALYNLKSETGAETDETKWAASMVLGEKIMVGKPRRATFEGDKKVYDFVEITRENGSTGLAWPAQIAEGGSLAVVIDEKANLYKSPKTLDVTGIILSRKTVVTYFPETEKDGFVEIKCFDPFPKTPAYRQNYVRLSSLSRTESDIQSSILLQTAEPLKNEGADKIRKDALLEAAMLDYPDSAFSDEIQALLNPNTQAVIATTSPDKSFMTVIDDNVNVRDLPDTVAGRVVGELSRDDGTVTVSEQSAAIFTVEGQSAFWYHIVEPVNGWVFGAFLE